MHLFAFKLENLLKKEYFFTDYRDNYEVYEKMMQNQTKPHHRGNIGGDIPAHLRDEQPATKYDQQSLVGYPTR